MDLERLKDRLSNRSEQDVQQIVNIIERYNLKFTVRNFDSSGVLFRDEQGRSVRVSHGPIRNGFIHIEDPKADIVIVFADGLLSGWIEYDKMDDLKDRMSIDVKTLHRMPESFVFNQQCPHLDVHGGFYEGSFWECVGCGERLVFNDNE